MHVHRKRSRGRVITETPLFPAGFSKGQAQPAEFAGHRGEQITRLAQLIKILVEKTIFPVVHRSALHASRQKLPRKDLLFCNCLSHLYTSIETRTGLE